MRFYKFFFYRNFVFGAFLLDIFIAIKSDLTLNFYNKKIRLFYLFDGVKIIKYINT